jgi:TPR repeat protein
VVLASCDRKQKVIQREIVIVKVPVAQPEPEVEATPQDTVATDSVIQEETPVEIPQQELTPDSAYVEGMAAFDARQGLEAIQAFNRSSYPEAYYMLGVIYEQGCGTIGKNPMLARKNFKKAAEMGSETAKTKL